MNTHENEKKLFERIKKIVVERLDVHPDKVTRQASFMDDLEADSLDVVELILSLEEEFDISISDERATKIGKVEDAIAEIQQTLNEK
jgi:acyl carrier protein